MTRAPRGKLVRSFLYLHVSAFELLTVDEVDLIVKAEKFANIQAYDHYNVLKLNTEKNTNTVSFLKYQDFQQFIFPELVSSIKVNLTLKTIRHFDYSKRNNPPVLHRKELLLLHNDPMRFSFEQLSKQLERDGLFDNTREIGFKNNWFAKLEEHGWTCDGRIISKTQYSAPKNNSRCRIDRHKTAIARTFFSRPVQCLYKHGYIDKKYNFLDYGCGRGGDFRLLRKAGIDAIGWDPHYFPDIQLTKSDIVNLGFVLNVIEDQRERQGVLENAFELTNILLVVSAYLNISKPSALTESYNDGMLTTKNTFQKQYTHEELKLYIESILRKEAIGIGPGIFFVFKSSEEKEKFYLQKSISRSITSTCKIQNKVGKHLTSEKSKQIFEFLIGFSEARGRFPAENELCPDIVQGVKEFFGSHRKAISYCKKSQEFKKISFDTIKRKEDILVYLSLNYFNDLKKARQVPPEVLSDIRFFWGSIQKAKDQSFTALYHAGDAKIIESACAEANSKGLGWIDKKGALSLHSDLVASLPIVLRIYAGCASKLVGDISIADVVKFHSMSKKFTMLITDDFFNSPIPKLLARIKINLKNQSVSWFDYAEEGRTVLLYMKSRFMHTNHPHYKEQLDFDNTLVNLKCFDFDGHGPDANSFYSALNGLRLKIEGFTIKKSKSKMQ